MLPSVSYGIKVVPSGYQVRINLNTVLEFRSCPLLEGSHTNDYGNDLKLKALGEPAESGACAHRPQFEKHWSTFFLRLFLPACDVSCYLNYYLVSQVTSPKAVLLTKDSLSP